MKILNCFQLAVAGVGVASAFAPRQMNGHCALLQARQAQILSDIDAMCIVNAADLCSSQDSTGDPDEQQALMNRLESQAHHLEIRLEEMRSLVFALSERPRVAILDTHQVAGPVIGEIDTMSLMNTARFCANEGCSIDDREALINRLQEQYTSWNLRLLEILATMKRLEAHLYRMPAGMRDPEMDFLLESIGSALTMDYVHNGNKVPIGSYL